MFCKKKWRRRRRRNKLVVQELFHGATEQKCLLHHRFSFLITCAVVVLHHFLWIHLNRRLQWYFCSLDRLDRNTETWSTFWSTYDTFSPLPHNGRPTRHHYSTGLRQPDHHQHWLQKPSLARILLLSRPTASTWIHDLNFHQPSALSTWPKGCVSLEDRVRFSGHGQVHDFSINIKASDASTRSLHTRKPRKRRPFIDKDDPS